MGAFGKNPRKEDIQAWLLADLSSRIGVDAHLLDPGERFSRYGLDSFRAVGMLAALAIELERPLSPTMVWDYPTVEALSRFLAGEAPEAESPSEARSYPTLASAPIAVIGLACRFPGAATAEAFWSLLRDGRDAIVEVPADRWNIGVFYDADVSAVGKMATRWGGFLAQVDRFDPQFFGISPREAIEMDPQQRLMLELAWEALEDAGVPPRMLRGSRTGVFVGAMWNDYAKLAAGDMGSIVQHTATGQDLSIVPARVSYTFGLEGPSIAVNTACSSALVAVHLACQSLRDGESTVALAGGVSLILAPDSTVAMTKFGAMAPDGRCKAFDAGANGYVRGEGAGLLVLKPLSAALLAGDPIRAVIRGSAVNNDGFSNGLTAPNPKAQEAVLRDAYRRAGIEPARVHYVETHGPGTELGDPIEAKALGAVLGVHRPVDRPLKLGSVKTNIGHLEAAAGIAGLIKTVLAIQHRMIPPNLHFERPNPHIPFADLKLQVQQALEPWPHDDEVPLAGVSSFGFGGTNCHLVLEAAPSSAAQLLPLSACTPQALNALAGEIKALAATSEAPIPLADLCYTAAAQLSQHPYRLALTVRSHADLASRLENYLHGQDVPCVVKGPLFEGRPGPVFVFAGYGSQWSGMGLELLQGEAVFRAMLERCDLAFRPLTGWSLLDALTADPSHAAVQSIDVQQPLVFAIQVALATLWQSWGIAPQAVIGHSMGEIAAAYTAGILQLPDALRVIYQRSRLQQQTAGRGAMVLVELGPEEANRVVAAYEGRLCVAAFNSPVATVIAGEESAIQALLDSLERQGIGAQRVKVSIASHSWMMDPILSELGETLRELQPQPARLPMVSTVTASVLDGTRYDASYWVRNVREPVCFMQALTRLCEQGHNLFIEIGPHPILSRSIEQSLSCLHTTGSVLPSMRRGEAERVVIRDSLGQLYTEGASIRWCQLYPAHAKRVALPAALMQLCEPLETEGAFSDVQLLPLSAHTAGALRECVQRLLVQIAEPCNTAVHDLCYTASVRRSHLEHRLALVVDSRQGLMEKLRAFLQGDDCTGIVAGSRTAGRRPKLAFVFSGQGSQWVGMGRDLMEKEPIFRQVFDQCAALLERHAHWSLYDELSAVQSSSRLDDTEVAQPAIFAIQMALAALWKAWGIEPDAVVGHSMGEVAAATVAGMLSLEDAVQVIAHRGRIMQKTTGLGKMAAIGLSLQEVAPWLERYAGRLSVAAINSPDSAVLSGETGALEEVLQALHQHGIFGRLLNVNYAFHSPQMEPHQDDLVRALGDLPVGKGAMLVVSTVTGKSSSEGTFDASYWGQNIREPVRFAAAIDELIGQGCSLFVEVGPHPVLLQPMTQCLDHRQVAGTVLPSMRRDRAGRFGMLESLGTLYAYGYPVDWNQLYPDGGRCVSLPSYPFQRKRYWREVAEKSQPVREKLLHPLLGRRLRSAARPLQFEAQLGVHALPFLHDHRVYEMPVFPVTALLEMVLAAAGAVLDPTQCLVDQIVLHEPLFLPKEGDVTIQLILTPAENAQAENGASFEFFSLEEDATSWKRHAFGAVRLCPRENRSRAVADGSLASAWDRCSQEVSAEEHYQRMCDLGLLYGPSFQGIKRLRLGEGEAFAEVELPGALAGEAQDYRLHPVLLDACLQTLVALLPGHHQDAVLPFSIDGYQLDREPGDRLWCHARLLPDELSEAGLIGKISLFDQSRQAVGRLDRLDLRPIGRTQLLRKVSSSRDNRYYQVQWHMAESRPQGGSDKTDEAPGSWLLFADHGNIWSQLVSMLEQRGARCVTVHHGEMFEHIAPDRFWLNPADPGALDQVLERAFGEDRPPCRGVVHLWSLDIAPPRETVLEVCTDEQLLSCGSALHVVQALARTGWSQSPRLWLVTRGAQSVGRVPGRVAVAQAPVWALGNVIALEHPDLRCVRVDLDPAGSRWEVRALFEALRATEQEDRMAFRDGVRYVARLVSSASTSGKEPEATVLQHGQPVQLTISHRGVLNNLTLEPALRSHPGPGEVEMRVVATGLNFRDVLDALGVYPGDAGPFGGECAGTVVAVGEGVDNYKVGDEVIAVFPRTGAFRSFATVSARFVTRKPEHLSFAEAATLPIAYLTAYYGLHHLAQMTRGERLLIHAAAGGVGMAAVQLAKRAEAKILATAGSPEKRQFLQSIGVEHTMNSRSLDFADEVMTITAGQGVDIVLNALSGEYIPKSLSTLGANGRFLEMGKNDIWSASQMAGAREDVSYWAFDLAEIARQNPELIQAMLGKILATVQEGALKPLPLQEFPYHDVVGAFRFMAGAKHIGKIVVTQQPHGEKQSMHRRHPWRSHGTYFITGGLGALGLQVARYLVKRGAQHIVLVGRKAPSSSVHGTLEELRQHGSQVVVAQVDVAQRGALSKLLGEMTDVMPPLRGVVHAAGVLDDGVLLSQDWQRFASVMAPKVDGAWNLHHLTRNLELDFFVLFSSVASVTGLPGQGNYAAANGFLDALAHYRRAVGLPATCINWGPWAQSGMAAGHRRHLWEAQGMSVIAPEEGLQALEELLQGDAIQVTYLSTDWAKFVNAVAPGKHLPLLADLMAQYPPKQDENVRSFHAEPFLHILQTSAPSARQALLRDHIHQQAARILGMAPADLDAFLPLKDAGLDSLMALTLTRTLGSRLGVQLMPTLIFNHPSVEALTAFLAQKLSLHGIEDTQVTQEIDLAGRVAAMAELQQLSEAEMDAIVADELSKLIEIGNVP